MTDLLPCPFCGSNNLRHEFCGSQGYIECNECGTQGPCDERAADPHCEVEAAEAAWNRRAALSQPKPSSPTDQELHQLFREWRHEYHYQVQIDADDFESVARAVLARWGHPAIEPVPVAERLPGPQQEVEA